MKEILTSEEHLNLVICRDAIDLMLENGAWHMINGMRYWVVPEHIADAASDMINRIEDSE